MKELRQRLQRSRTAMGNLLGISRQAWSLYETGDRIPNAQRIGELAAACGVSTDWLILGREAGAPLIYQGANHPVIRQVD